MADERLKIIIKKILQEILLLKFSKINIRRKRKYIILETKTINARYIYYT